MDKVLRGLASHHANGFMESSQSTLVEKLSSRDKLSIFYQESVRALTKKGVLTTKKVSKVEA